MKALVYTATEEIKYQDVSVPEPADGEARIKIEAVGICGSDIHAYHGKDERRVPPLILGHEAAGVVETGELKVGTYTYTHNDLEKALLTLNSGALSDLSWIEERPLAEGSSAFSDLDNGQTAAPNIVLHPHV